VSYNHEINIRTRPSFVGLYFRPAALRWSIVYRICLTYVFRSDSRPGLPLPYLYFESNIIMLVAKLQRRRLVAHIYGFDSNFVNFLWKLSRDLCCSRSRFAHSALRVCHFYVCEFIIGLIIIQCIYVQPNNVLTQEVMSMWHLKEI